MNKKVNSDLFLLLLLVARLGLEPHIRIINRWNREPESRSVFLGPTSAYTQINFHAPFSSGRYPHPKSIELNELDEATILFSRLNLYDSLRNGGSNLIACIANSLDSEGGDQYHESHNPESPGNGFVDHSIQATGNTMVSNGNTNERESSMRLETVELSPEDMDLIEILWKQDIDLGVSRDAYEYDSRQSLELEKLKSVEITKEQDLYNQPEPETCEEASPVPDLLAGLNYTIDSETGEYVIEEFSELTDCHNIDDEILKKDAKLVEAGLLEENGTLGALSHDSYLPFDENNEFCNFTEVFSPTQLTQLLNEDISVDSDYLSQIEDLEKELEQFETLTESSGTSPTTGEMYPNMEDCWPDSTTMLPLLAFSSTHPTSITSLSPHPMHGYPGVTTTSSVHLPSTQQNRPSDSFIGMLQNVSLEVPATEEEFHPTSISSATGPSSVGCAVAESMATLTNDTDPLPKLLLDDDLHLVSLPSNGNEDKTHDDHMDTSSDSVSLTSGQLPSISDYESERSFSDVQFDQVNCNDQQYFTMKPYYSDVPDNCAGEKISFNKRFDYSVPKSSGMSASNFLHHNHSYHLPFTSDESRNKPITKDKSKPSDETCNKDEKRAKELKLPISIHDIINLAIDEYNERLSKYELTEAQLTLIRDIRRRGKNKVAAQNCRKRKMDQISSLKQDLSFLQREKMQLKSKQNHLLQEKQRFEDKYKQLYDLVLQSSNAKPPNPPHNLPVHRNDRLAHSTSSELFSDDDSDPNRVYAFRCIGKGKTAARTFCAIMSLLPPPEKFEGFNNSLSTALEKVCSKSMMKAVEGAVGITAKGYQKMSDSKVYGEEIMVEKLECIGHSRKEWEQD
ncbi:Segmentation protein cap'n'collar like protein [Argiope bruennichi]|uniref:Segmentation protein cap'n'collar like protein n=1 Tax=Argiope bruennichi TaxID=94029 RepID=A0A8T0F4G1_ARGBR|nr:Segmentation protein cap'n'collar like protein [Argiope bruennichi]